MEALYYKGVKVHRKVVKGQHNCKVCGGFITLYYGNTPGTFVYECPKCSDERVLAISEVNFMDKRGINPARVWTPEEEKILFENAPFKNFKELAPLIPGRTPAMVRSKLVHEKYIRLGPGYIPKKTLEDLMYVHIDRAKVWKDLRVIVGVKYNLVDIAKAIEKMR